MYKNILPTTLHYVQIILFSYAHVYNYTGTHFQEVLLNRHKLKHNLCVYNKVYVIIIYPLLYQNF